MKNIILFFSIAFSNLVLSYDDYDIDEEVEAEGFIVGRDNNLGGVFYYIVDKTNGLCFAGNTFQSNTGAGGGLTAVDCENLKSTPKIKKYLSGEKID